MPPFIGFQVHIFVTVRIKKLSPATYEILWSYNTKQESQIRVSIFENLLKSLSL